MLREDKEQFDIALQSLRDSGKLATLVARNLPPPQVEHARTRTHTHTSWPATCPRPGFRAAWRRPAGPPACGALGRR